MKVVYVTIEKQIRDAVYNADCRGRRIDHIELTQEEAKELWRETESVRRFSTHAMLRFGETIKDGDHYWGVMLKVAKT